MTPPKDTPGLIKLVNFITETRDTVLPELKKQAFEILLCELFSMEFVKFTGESLRQNTSTFQWTKYIKRALYDSQNIVEVKTDEFKEALIKRIETFNNDLIDYKSKLDEFTHFDNINDINIYVNESHNLDDKLKVALETIDEINNLEIYFKIKESAYPLRKVVNIYSKHEKTIHISIKITKFVFYRLQIIYCHTKDYTKTVQNISRTIRNG